MESVRSARSTLLDKALALPIANRSDFFGKHQPPVGADPSHLRLINDTALRSRHIQAAEGPAPRAAAFGLPTVEELNVLLSRIHATEIDVSRELQSKLNVDIDRLKREIGHLEGDAFERAFRDLQNAIETRKRLAGEIREEAFRRIEADASFGARRYLRLIGRHRPSED